MHTHGGVEHVEGSPGGTGALDGDGGALDRTAGPALGTGGVHRRTEAAPHGPGHAPDRAKLEGSLSELVERLSVALERSNVLDYTILLQHPWRMMWINFLSGAARGLGIGIGFTVLTAILLYILRGLMVANLPVIGDLIATIVRLVEQQLRP